MPHSSANLQKERRVEKKENSSYPYFERDVGEGGGGVRERTKISGSANFKTDKGGRGGVVSWG